MRERARAVGGDREVTEWKGEGVKLERISTIGTTNTADPESLCVVEISFKKPLKISSGD